MSSYRKIKFRVWDKTEKSFMIEDTEHGRFFNADGSAYLTDILAGNHPTLIPQQFTELKDKNHKELYEGDLVKSVESHDCYSVLNKPLPTYTLGQVVFLCQGFNICQSSIGRTPLEEFAMCECCPCGLEIVGNVCELSTTTS